MSPATAVRTLYSLFNFTNDKPLICYYFEVTYIRCLNLIDADIRKYGISEGSCFSISYSIMTTSMRFSLGPLQDSTSVIKDSEEVQRINSNHATFILPENIFNN